MIKRIIASLLVLLTIIGSVTKVYADNVAYNTYAVTTGGWHGRTQTAYEVLTTISLDEISAPNDIYIDYKDYIYIADSTLGHIVVLDNHRNLSHIIGEQELTRPTGVSVDREGYVFVADSDAVFKFDEAGNLVDRFGRPTDPLFGATTPFRPMNVSTDQRGNIYVVGEASTNGIIVLNAQGEFLNFFGVNPTNLTLFQTLQNIFTPVDQRQFLNAPVPPTDIAINERGTIFTVTTGGVEPIRQLNIAGTNILGTQRWNMSDTPIAITTAPNAMGLENFYVLDAQGLISEYTSEGELLFYWGGTDNVAQRQGIFRNPSSIAISSDGTIYVTDMGTGLIHVFAKTDFAYWVHQALRFFEMGRYVESKDYWEQVLRFHDDFAIAHLAMGQASFLQEDYENARESFYIGGFVSGYSQAFWEIRNVWLLNNTSYLIGGILIIFIASQVHKFVKKRSKKEKKVYAYQEKQIYKDFKIMTRILRHPLLTFEAIKYNGIGSVLVASIIYGVSVVVFLLSYIFTGFIFRNPHTDIILLLGMYILGMALYIGISYLISTINDGEGSFRNMYVATSYGLSPVIFMFIPVSLLSLVLTLNEAFIYTTLIQVSVAYSILLQFLMIKEIHDYSVKDTIKNVLLTIFGIASLLVVVFIVYLLLSQVGVFIKDVILEVIARV